MTDTEVTVISKLTAMNGNLLHMSHTLYQRYLLSSFSPRVSASTKCLRPYTVIEYITYGSCTIYGVSIRLCKFNSLKYICVELGIISLKSINYAHAALPYWLHYNHYYYAIKSMNI